MGNPFWRGGCKIICRVFSLPCCCKNISSPASLPHGYQNTYIILSPEGGFAKSFLSLVFMITGSPESTFLHPQPYSHSLLGSTLVSALYKYIFTCPLTAHCQIHVRLLKWPCIHQPWRWEMQCLPYLWQTVRILYSLFPKAEKYKWHFVY